MSDIEQCDFESMTIDYSFDLTTGDMEITVDFKTPAGTLRDEHFRKHMKNVLQLLAQSGLVRPGQSIVVYRDQEVFTYQATQRVAEGGQIEWVWNVAQGTEQFTPLEAQANNLTMDIEQRIDQNAD